MIRNNIERSYRCQVHVGVWSLLLFRAPSLSQDGGCHKADSHEHVLCRHGCASRSTWRRLRLIYSLQILESIEMLSIDVAIDKSKYKTDYMIRHLWRFVKCEGPKRSEETDVEKKKKTEERNYKEWNTWGRKVGVMGGKFGSKEHAMVINGKRMREWY